MMAEVMADKTKGKAILDETCENTNVVNELNIPILCMGCKDMIVAASGDGILIADKERSGYMQIQYLRLLIMVYYILCIFIKMFTIIIVKINQEWSRWEKN